MHLLPSNAEESARDGVRRHAATLAQHLLPLTPEESAQTDVLLRMRNVLGVGMAAMAIRGGHLSRRPARAAGAARLRLAELRTRQPAARSGQLAASRLDPTRLLAGRGSVAI